MSARRNGSVKPIDLDGAALAFDALMAFERGDVPDYSVEQWERAAGGAASIERAIRRESRDLKRLHQRTAGQRAGQEARRA